MFGSSPIFNLEAIDPSEFSFVALLVQSVKRPQVGIASLWRLWAVNWNATIVFFSAAGFIVGIFRAQFVLAQDALINL